MATADVSEVDRLRRELSEERDKLGKRNLLIQKLEEELHVMKIHIKLLKNKPQEELETTKRKLVEMRINRDRLECQLKRAEEMLRKSSLKSERAPEK
jgi:hypothetical protein